VACPGRVTAVYYLNTVIHKITSLKLQKRNRQRVNVYLDGKYAFGLARIVATWLKTGQEIDDNKITQLLAEDNHEKAYQHALKYLRYRPRTEAEIHKKLKEHDVSDGTISSVIKRLIKNNLIDDKTFALTWVENRRDFRPRSRRMLAYELRQRGVNQQTINQTLEHVNDEDMAYQAATKQARKYQNFDIKSFRKKMYGFLARRGFNYDVSSRVVSHVWSELEINYYDNSQNEEEYL
jgi:regulatory protein